MTYCLNSDIKSKNDDILSQNYDMKGQNNVIMSTFLSIFTLSYFFFSQCCVIILISSQETSKKQLRIWYWILIYWHIDTKRDEMLNIFSFFWLCLWAWWRTHGTCTNSFISEELVSGSRLRACLRVSFYSTALGHEARSFSRNTQTHILHTYTPNTFPFLAVSFTWVKIH